MAEGMKYSTPHIHAAPSDFAKTVLMPGDPARARFIAEHFFTGARLVNDVRGVQGYTGTYKGTPISVMASGMGMPSIGIYSYELYNIFGIENIIRIGSCGAMQEDVRLRDLVFAVGASTNSAFESQYQLPGSFSPIADFTLLRTAVEESEKAGIPYQVGNVLSSDVFYYDDPETTAKWSKMGVLAVEMEAAALYMTAARARRRALGMFTVSDHFLTGEHLSAEERATGFTDMIRVALETAIRLET